MASERPVWDAAAVKRSCDAHDDPVADAVVGVADGGDADEAIGRLRGEILEEQAAESGRLGNGAGEHAAAATNQLLGGIAVAWRAARARQRAHGRRVAGRCDAWHDVDGVRGVAHAQRSAGPVAVSGRSGAASSSSERLSGIVGRRSPKGSSPTSGSSSCRNVYAFWT